tara:strand:+ start:324 stop:710 length:387 start_codon:yes stop_codon:yes gene_type:complete
MSGALDTALRAIAKQVVSDFGSELNTTITYSVNSKGSYNVAAGKQMISTTSYTDIKVAIEFIQAEEDKGREIRRARIHVTPDLIGNHQPTFDDEITLSYGGQSKVAQIIDVSTKGGDQVYIHTIEVRF